MTGEIDVENLFKIYAPTQKLITQATGLVKAGRREEAAKLPNTVVAVDDVSLNIEQGEIFIVMGLSGSGKSTLIRCLNRLIEPTAGSIRVRGEDILGKSARELRDFRRTKIAMVFQHFALLPHKSVLDNVEYGLLIRGVERSRRRDQAVEALEMVGLGAWKDYLPDSLSGGMKQRVGLARALANEPEILLMDEPFSALDPLIRAEMQKELVTLQKNLNKTIVFITHDFHEAITLGDRIAIMKDGAVIQVGASEDLVVNPANDYVARFTQELDRSKILTVSNILRATHTINQRDLASARSGGKSAKSVKKSNGYRFSFVLGDDEKPVGYIDNRASPSKGTAASNSHDQIKKNDFISVKPDQRLCDLFGSFEHDRPVAVVDDHGKFLGHIDASDILSSLAASEAGAGTDKKATGK